MLSDKAQAQAAEQLDLLSRERYYNKVDQTEPLEKRGCLMDREPQRQLDTLKAIKNGIIGNKTKKLLYVRLDIIPKLLEFLKSDDEGVSLIQTIKTQAAIVLGSLAYGAPDIVQELVKCDVIPCLLGCLDLKNNRLELIEAAARALKAIFQHLPKVNCYQLYDPPHLKAILALLRFSPPHEPNSAVPTLYTAELAAMIMAYSCDDPARQTRLVQEGAVPLLMDLLMSGSLKAQEAALEAISALCHENRDVGRHIVEYQGGIGSPMEVLLDLARSMDPRMQLAAASCLTNLTRADAIPDHLNSVMLIVLPTLIKLLDTSSGPTQIEAPLILAYLVSDNEAMQKAASEADAIYKLAEIIARLSKCDENTMMREYQSHDKDQFEENALMALAAVSTLKEECRQQVIEAKALPHIVSAMGHPRIGIRSAACQCTRSLSRSVRNLRTSLVDAGVAEPLFKLLDDESIEVQTSALATLCNIVLDFSPMKKHIIENGGVNRLVSLLDSPHHQLRLNAVWALKNLLFQADPQDKSTVMERLSYSKLRHLMEDPDPAVQEQALGLLRNLSCGKDLVVCNIFSGIGSKDLLRLLEAKLKSKNDPLIIHTLYIIVNIATGTTEHKTALMESSEILQSIQRFMSHSLHTIRVASVWCIINLSWIDNNQPSSDCLARIRKLRTLGFERTLKQLLNDVNLDVKDRAKTALDNFRTELQSHGGVRFTTTSQGEQHTITAPHMSTPRPPRFSRPYGNEEEDEEDEDVLVGDVDDEEDEEEEDEEEEERITTIVINAPNNNNQGGGGSGGGWPNSTSPPSSTETHILPM